MIGHATPSSSRQMRLRGDDPVLQEVAVDVHMAGPGSCHDNGVRGVALIPTASVLGAGSREAIGARGDVDFEVAASIGGNPSRRRAFEPQGA